MGLTQAALANAMGVPRKHVNELCNNRRKVTAATALILSRVFGNTRLVSCHGRHLGAPVHTACWGTRGAVALRE